ncbi:beta strand repeat-containing protein, partial [Sagittula sp. S175]|uniref:beta strand repeat-containing protein n=1 Tax=Sagittula sp. S175 TaxID=3415129 RepID=UPI003C79FADF
DGGALNATTIANSLDIIVTTGTVTSNGAALNNNAGASLAINGGALTGLGAIDNTSAEADAITLAAGTNLGFTTLTSSAGMISVGSGASLTGTSVALTGAADLDLNGGTITGTLDNQSTVQISLEGNVNGAFTQQGAGVETLVDGTGVIFGDTATISTGLLNADANVDVTNALTLAAGTSLDVADNVTVNGGTVSIGALAAATLGNGVTISSDTGDLSNDTTLSFGTDGTLSSAAALTNSGAVTFGTNGTMTSVGAFDNVSGAGSITFNDGGTLSSGTGTITNGGPLTVNDGSVTTANTSIVASGMGTGITLSGGDLNLGTGTLTDSLTGSLIALTVAGDASGTATFTASALTFSEARFDLDSSVALATLDVGTVTLNGVAAASTLFGTITGAVDLNAGTLTVDGDSTIGGAVSVDGTAPTTTLTIDDGATLTASSGVTVGAATTTATDAVLDVNGSLTGNITNTNGTVLLGDGLGSTTITGTLTQDGGETSVLSATTITGLVTLNDGTLTVAAGETLTASTAINAASNVTIDNDGTIVGQVNLTGINNTITGGTFTNLVSQNDPAGVLTFTGATTLSAGFLNTAGTFIVNAPMTLGAASSNAGTLDLNANVLGGQTITNTGTATLASASFTGNYTQNGGQTTIDGNTALFDTGPSTGVGIFSVNAGTLDVLAGMTLQAVTMDFGSGATVNLYDGATLYGTGNTHLNGGIENVLGATANLVEATGNIVLESTGSILMRSDIQQTLNVTLSGAGKTFTADAGSVISMIDATTPDTSDRIMINGDAVLNGTIQMDVNVSGSTVGAVAADTADRVVATGNVSGTPNLQLQNVSATYANIAAPVTLVESTGGTTAGLSATLTGLPVGGSYTYSLQNTGTQVQLTATPNLAFGGVVSGVAATQSLISTVVNRPSSALVTPLVSPGDDPCAVGTWGRVTGGKAKASLGTTSVNTGISATNDIDLSYGGVQMGIDNSCSGGYYNGWDLAYGAMLGTNMGKTTLPVSLGSTSTTIKSDFDQLFGGVYLSAAKGNWFGDINLRTDKTTYKLSETNTFGLGGLGLSSQKFDSRGRTVSGSLSYSHTLNQEKNIRLVPTLGFSLSKITTDSISIENDPTTTADDAVLQIGDITQKIGYLGATIAQTKVQPSGDAALTYFATGTYFKDFGDDLKSTFTVTSTGAQQSLVSENLDGFGELSFGVNYTKIMSGQGALPARQMDASIRADTRFSDQLDSWGLTAQVRLQF